MSTAGLPGTSQSALRSARGSVSLSERALAPDLARGLMLLLIALANTPYYIYGADRSVSSAHPVGGSVTDQIVQVLIITGVDARVYPMFAFLFGYGIVQLYRRQYLAGVEEKAARRVLRRRHWWLLVFGLAHAALLWMGDILGTYALSGLIVVWLFLRRRDTTLVIWVLVVVSLILSSTAAVVAILVPLGFLADLDLPNAPTLNPFDLVLANIATPDYLASILPRIGVWAVITALQGVSLIIPTVMLLAFWAARRCILEEPGRHHRLLVEVAVVGIAIGWLGGLPHGLAHVGLIVVPDGVSWIFASTQATTGLFCGVGYVALFGLLAERLAARGPSRPVPVVALAALGQRSLSGYLAQSLICAPMLAAWGLGLGARLGSAAVALFALASWLVTLAGAYLLERVGRRGPTEVLLRRLAYGR